MVERGEDGERLRFVVCNELPEIELISADETARPWTVATGAFAFARPRTWKGHVDYRGKATVTTLRSLARSSTAATSPEPSRRAVLSTMGAPVMRSPRAHVRTVQTCSTRHHGRAGNVRSRVRQRADRNDVLERASDSRS